MTGGHYRRPEIPYGSAQISDLFFDHTPIPLLPSLPHPPASSHCVSPCRGSLVESQPHRPSGDQGLHPDRHTLWTWARAWAWAWTWTLPLASSLLSVSPHPSLPPSMSDCSEPQAYSGLGVLQVDLGALHHFGTRQSLALALALTSIPISAVCCSVIKREMILPSSPGRICRRYSPPCHAPTDRAPAYTRCCKLR